MKHWFLSILLLACTGLFVPVLAQDGALESQKAQRLEALKIAYINQKLQLTPEEAQRFWPVYTQYENELDGLQRQAVASDVLAIEQAKLDIKKKYRDQFVRVIGQPRMNRLFETEKDFNRMLLNQLRNRQRAGAMQRRGF